MYVHVMNVHTHILIYTYIYPSIYPYIHAYIHTYMHMAACQNWVKGCFGHRGSAMRHSVPYPVPHPVPYPRRGYRMAMACHHPRKVYPDMCKGHAYTAVMHPHTHIYHMFIP